MGFQDDNLPCFGKISDIIIAAGSTPLLAVTEYKTEFFNAHLSAYNISRTNKHSILLLSELLCHQPFYSHMYIGDSRMYIVMRSHVPKLN